MMSWNGSNWNGGNQFTSQMTITTTTTQQMQGVPGHDSYQIAYGAPSGKSAEYRADARVQNLANALRKDLEAFRGPFYEYVAESYRVTPDQTYHIKVRTSPGQHIEVAVYSSE